MVLVTQANPSDSEHLRNSNKLQLILTKFYVNFTSSVRNQNAKFR